MSQLKPLVMTIFECCQDAKKHHCAVFEKYSSPKYKRAASYVADELEKGFKPAISIPTTAQVASGGHAMDDSHLLEYNRANLLISSES
jgi:hypothetical protein